MLPGAILNPASHSTVGFGFQLLIRWLDARCFILCANILPELIPEAGNRIALLLFWIGDRLRKALSHPFRWDR
jgi:hypothetical protein